MASAARSRAAAWHRIVAIGALARTAAAIASAGGIAVVVPGAEPAAVVATARPERGALGCEAACVRTGSLVAPVIPAAVFILARVPLRVVPAAASTVAIVIIPISAFR